MPPRGSKRKQVALTVTKAEYQRLQTRFASSTCQSLAAYCREVLLSHPVVFRYHNATSDEFLVIALQLKDELDGVVQSLRQRSESPIGDLIEKVEELKLIMHQIYQQWSST